MLDIYRKRDNIEKTFRWLKQSSRLDNYARYDNAFDAKIFISFLSSIIRGYIFNKVKKYFENHFENSFNTIMYEFRKIKVTKFSDKYIRKNSLSKKQKEILNLLEIDSKDISKTIEKLNNLMN